MRAEKARVLLKPVAVGAAETFVYVSSKKQGSYHLFTCLGERSLHAGIVKFGDDCGQGEAVLSHWGEVAELDHDVIDGKGRMRG